jgi:hypothetical protein
MGKRLLRVWSGVVLWMPLITYDNLGSEASEGSGRPALIWWNLTALR